MALWAIIALCVVGLANAAYFTLIYYGVLGPSPLVPSVLCRTEERSCTTVVQTPYARVFWLPNSLYGLFFYLFIGVVAWLTLRGLAAPLTKLLALGLTGLAVLFGFYLVYALLVKLKTPCPLCFLGHAINLMLFLLWLYEIAGG